MEFDQRQRRKNIIVLASFCCVSLIIFVLLFSFSRVAPSSLVQLQNTKTSSKCTKSTVRPQAHRLEIAEASWSRFQKQPHLSEVCRIMPQCFPHVKTLSVRSQCIMEMSDMMDEYDSGFLVKLEGDDESISGFMSAIVTKAMGHYFVKIYNVCIDPSCHGHGLGTKMIHDFLKEYVSKRQLDATKTIFALSVDLSTESAKAAIRLYAKLGFTTIIEPCFEGPSVEGLQRALDPESANQQMKRLIADPFGYAREYYAKYTIVNARYPTHLCMYNYNNNIWNDKPHNIISEKIADAFIGKVAELGMSNRVWNDLHIED